ncbi:MAG: hypothetical protein WA869_32445 [Alloacidobacterium sp.]|jgi:hypothetical protein
MVLLQAAVLVVVGMSLGIVATLASASMLQAYLYGTGARNPLVLAGVCGLVAATGLHLSASSASDASGSIGGPEIRVTPHCETRVFIWIG